MIIKVTPQVLKSQSDQVAADINSIDKHWKEIESIIKNSKNYWEGDASSTHLRLYKDISDDVAKIIQRMKDNPIKLQKMAGVYIVGEDTAENRASELPGDLFG